MGFARWGLLLLAATAASAVAAATARPAQPLSATERARSAGAHHRQATVLQVGLGNFKPVVGLHHRGHAGFGLGTELMTRNQNTIRLFGTFALPFRATGAVGKANLSALSIITEALGVHAHFDHGGGHHYFYPLYKPSPSPNSLASGFILPWRMLTGTSGKARIRFHIHPSNVSSPASRILQLMDIRCIPGGLPLFTFYKPVDLQTVRIVLVGEML